MPHSPEYKSTIQIPCKFIKDATLDDAPVAKMFFSNITGGNVEDELTLREVAIELVGLENSHTLDIKQLHSTFGLGGIYGKRLIGSGDMKFARLPEIDKIKELTGRRPCQHGVKIPEFIYCTV